MNRQQLGGLPDTPIIGGCDHELELLQVNSEPPRHALSYHCLVSHNFRSEEECGPRNREFEALHTQLRLDEPDDWRLREHTGDIL
ncbi:hypothetical protein QA640_10830 [Bradyrhizobium sp. CB82]|uniref:hypothetical protein n=1 Tax=Bradyrhizobium sp. CB82 TaxID=3039159 RepID=UPI0024B1FB2C|nr:hypothetical protein [Bradyrhizobium sp. CB82]WFU45391.1 hypothetical protein QA640_10830 [Bradyrhizobium sp. CB82]